MNSHINPKTILHIDFNSYFATVEQQANPKLRGKPIGVCGGDRLTRTVIGAASIEAKKFGVRTAMPIWEAKQLCPQIILVPGDSDKYLSVTTQFLNILRGYSPDLEVFSIDEVFLELPVEYSAATALEIAREIKARIKSEIGEWMKCSVGISYNKLMAKLASNLQKVDGLVVIENEKQAIQVLDNLNLDQICGIGYRIKKRLNKLGIFTFKQLRAIPLNLLLKEFKSYGHFLYNASRGVDSSSILSLYDKPEVKSIGHQHTISRDTDHPTKLKQLLLKLTELIARKLRAKKLIGKTVHCWYRNMLDPEHLGAGFTGDGMQITVPYTNDGIAIFNAAWKIFTDLWEGQKIRMVGVSISNLKSQHSQTLSLLEDDLKHQKIITALDTINDKFGEFTLQRGILLHTGVIRRKANSFLADRRFKLSV